MVAPSSTLRPIRTHPHSPAIRPLLGLCHRGAQELHLFRNALLTLTYSKRSWACFSNFTWHVSLKRQPCPALLAWPKSPRSRSISTPRLYRSSGHGMSGFGVWNEVYEFISVSRSSFSRWELLGYQKILWNHWELFFILPEIISKPWQPWCSIPYLLGKL